MGTAGKLGGQRGVAGAWKDLTGSVNFKASNLTSQVRNIAQVTTAVASGDLSKKITVEGTTFTVMAPPASRDTDAPAIA